MRRDLREELGRFIPEDSIGLVTRSFDIYGSKRKAVVVIEIPEELREYEGSIARAIIKVNKNVASVLEKESGRRGDYRTRELRLVAGDPDTEVLHRESGCVFRLNPRTVYFSPRESSERAPRPRPWKMSPSGPALGLSPDSRPSPSPCRTPR